MDGHQLRGARIHRDMMLVSSVCRRALGCEWEGMRAVCTRHPFRIRIYRNMMLDSTVVCRRALGCEWEGMRGLLHPK